MLEVSQLVVNLPLFQSMAGSASNEDFVSFVYENVVGNEPSTSEVVSLTGLLTDSGGSMSKAKLLALVTIIPG